MARRVVTGINSDGKSYFVHNGPTPGRWGLTANEEIWVDDPARPDPASAIDPVDVEQFHLEPPLNGSVVRIITIPPIGETPDVSPELRAEMASKFDTGDAMERDNPGWHTTRTIDYGIVLSGEIVLEIDEGEVRLVAGDVVVQRATRHAWRNRGTQPCTIAFVLISSPNYQ